MRALWLVVLVPAMICGCQNGQGEIIRNTESGQTPFPLSLLPDANYRDATQRNGQFVNPTLGTLGSSPR
jgi:hypothetical protein